MKIISAPDYESMSRKAANIISAQVILFPDSVLGLATGSTPLGIYRQLIDWYKKGDLNFSKTHTVNLDEYCGILADNEQSYHFYMNSNFFNSVNIPPENINIPIGIAKDIDAECRRYDRLITELGGIDLQLLGIGHTGHIGFNEPDESFDKTTHCVKLKQKTIDANSHFFTNPDDVPKYAVTMGIKAIMQAKKLLLVANGPSKTDILYRVLFGPITPSVPASILQLHPDVTVVATEDALSAIQKNFPDLIYNTETLS
jgi:glucosamine-6-phosphate deaminase